ncbi:MAG: isoaspartyl peptidase/L-asparaginase family protein [Parvularculaceae bacterium]
MKMFLVRAVAALSFAFLAGASYADDGVSPVVLVHGGAGALTKGEYSAAEEAAYKAKLTEALEAAYAALDAGAPALDAVERAIVIMEDAPHFNAGRGAVFTRDGENELDASIMDGATANAGAVAGVVKVKNPIRLARAVMENSEHVMFSGEGAEKFARTQDLEMVSRSYFRTEARWRQYKQRLDEEKALRKQEKKERKGAALEGEALPKEFKYGTVGAVALDKNGDLAAGTSTGGMTLKRFGRVGDSPIIGSGTYADNRSCAVSSTGWGEYFIRLTIARDICAQVEYGGKTVADAANDVIHNRLQNAGGDGGVIVLGPNGVYAMTFNTAGMFRGVKTAEELSVAIYGE